LVARTRARSVTAVVVVEVGVADDATAATDEPKDNNIVIMFKLFYSI
jgi:SepF-like predicted cell division protein (DUF552 family)